MASRANPPAPSRRNASHDPLQPLSSRLQPGTSFSFLSSVPAHAIRTKGCCRTKGPYDPFKRHEGVFNFREWLSIMLEDSSYGRAWDVAQVMNDMERDLRKAVTSRTSPPDGALLLIPCSQWPYTLRLDYTRLRPLPHPFSVHHLSPFFPLF